MTPYLQLLNRLLQSFEHINNSTDFVFVFAPISLTKITSEEDWAPGIVLLVISEKLNGKPQTAY